MRSARAIREDNVLMVGPWVEGDAPAIFDGCSLAFLVAWPGVALDYPEWAQRLHARQIPFSLVLPLLRNGAGESEPIALAAYFSVEDASPCWRCLELRLLGWSPDAERDGAFLDALKRDDPGALPLPRDLAAVPLHAPWEVEAVPNFPVFPTDEEAVLMRWLAMDVTGSDPGVALLAAPDGQFTVHSFAPHPLCAICSPWAGAAAGTGEMPVERLSDPRLGLLRPAVTGVEVAIAAPTYPAGQRLTTPALPPFGPTGDDAEEEEARLDGLAAYAFSLRAGRPMWRGTRHGIPASAVHPAPFIPYGEAAGLIPYREGRELDWQRAHKLSWGEDVGIPADLIFGGPPWEHLMHPNPAGLAAHRHIEVAVRVALTRAAAADGLMAWWYVRMAPPRVPRQQLPATLRDACAAAEATGWEVAVVQMATDLGVPVIAFLGRSRGEGFAWGCGADLDPDVALHRALAGWRSSFAAARNPGLGTRTHLFEPGGNGAEHTPRPASRRRVTHEGLDFLFAGQERPLGPGHPDAHVHPLDTWRVFLQAAGMQAWWADITPPDVGRAGLVVVKTLISEALPLVQPDVPGPPHSARLLDLPRRLGRLDRRLGVGELNPLPHPFHVGAAPGSRRESTLTGG